MCINYKYYILIKNQLTNYSIILPNCIHFLPSSSPFLPPSLNSMHLLCYIIQCCINFCNFLVPWSIQKPTHHPTVTYQI